MLDFQKLDRFRNSNNKVNRAFLPPNASANHDIHMDSILFEYSWNCSITADIIDVNNIKEFSRLTLQIWEVV